MRPASNSEDELGPEDPTFVVGIGASAGGLEALEEFFTAVPADTGCAFVVIQHLSPDFESLMDELLGRRTAMPIRRAENGVRLARDTVYLIPPGKELALNERMLCVTDRPAGILSFPIDMFFRSLANDIGPRAIAIILSGTGTDGSRGIRDVRDAGGLVLIQDEVSAKFSGMPVSAAASGQAHAVLTPAQMPEKVILHTRVSTSGPPLTADRQRAYHDVSSLLLETHGLDLGQYKTMTVVRRIERRMPTVGATNLERYVEILKTDAAELARLHRDLLIGVTKFFRDPDAFDKLRETLPLIFANAGVDGIRVWVPGCATGQEAYTIASLLTEYAIREEFPTENIKVFATDVNRDSLSIASAGLYPEDLVDSSPEILRKNFESVDGMYRVNADLRKMIVFAPHNVLKDPPFTRLDIISCRNLLIYLTPAAQRRVVTLFHFALRRNGILFLGPSESLGEVESEFDILDVRSKLFRKRRDVRLTEKLHVTRNDPSAVRSPNQDDPMVHAAFHTLLQRYVPPTLMIDEQHTVVHVFGDASKYLTMRPGRTSLDIESVVHPDLRTSMVAAIHRIKRTRSPISYPSVRVKTEEGEHRLTLAAEPIRDRRLKADLYLISLERESTPEAPTARAKAQEPAGEAQDLQVSDLREELRATEERLETTIEELETSNEELQATNEELLSSNEEMQSTNEELQSVNEELYTVNAEHQRKIAELIELNHDLDNLLKGTAIETLFLDRSLRIRRYTAAVVQSFSLLPADVGRPLGHLASNLNYDGVLDDAERVLKTEKPIVREIRNKRGAWLSMQIRPYRTSTNVVEGVVVTFNDISDRKRLEEALDRNKKVIGLLIDAYSSPVVVFDAHGRRTFANPPAHRMLGDGGAIGSTLIAQQIRPFIEQTQKTGEASSGRLDPSNGSADNRVEYRLTPVFGANSEVTSLLCILSAVETETVSAEATTESPS